LAQDDAQNRLLPSVNKIPPEDFVEKDLEVSGALSMPDSGVSLNDYGISKMTVSCLYVESFSSDSRVGASCNSMAH
jgi:hypothetical protein